MAYNATQNTITDTAPAPNAAPTMNPTQSQPGGTAPHNPYAGRRGRRQIANPFGPPDAQSMGAGGGAPSQPGGVQGGPNPMAMNQWGMAPQAATGGNPMSSVVATPNAPITSTVPGGGAPNLQIPGPPSGQYVPDWASGNAANEARYAKNRAGSFGGGNINAPEVNGQPGFTQWQNLINQTERAQGASSPYQLTALNRLGGFYTNAPNPFQGTFTSVANPSSAAQGTADALVAQRAGAVSADSLGNDPRSATFSLGSQVQGEIDPNNPFRTQAYGQALDQSVQGLTNTPDYGTLAQRAFEAQNASSDLGLDRQLRQIREQQAADGRLGLAADTQVNDLLARTMADRNAQSAQLALQAAGATSADNRARTSTLGDLYGRQTGTGLAALGLGRGLSSDRTNQQQGNLNSLQSYANQLFGQGQQGFQNQVGERNAALDFTQRGIQNTLANNAQNYAQTLGLAQFGDQAKFLQPYMDLANIEGGNFRTRVGG